MAEQIRGNKWDKLRLVKKRRKTGNKTIGLKKKRQSSGKAGVLGLNPAGS